MTKIIYRISLIDGDNCIAFEFPNYEQAASFIITSLNSAVRPANISAVITQLREYKEED